VVNVVVVDLQGCSLELVIRVGRQFWADVLRSFAKVAPHFVAERIVKK
jgi:hypothetical protein